MKTFTLALAGVAGLAAVASADGVRIAAWNITNYTGGQATNIHTAVYGSFNGRQFAPDVILLQEMSSASAVVSLRNHLNSAPGSPGDWEAARTFANGSLNTALVYRTSRFDVIGETLVAAGGGPPLQPRNVVRYDLRLEGYASEEATFAFYPTHMKAGSTTTDQQRRLVEANEVLADALQLPAGRHFVLGGDFNTQSSTQAGFRALVGNTYNTGFFVDPITAPGTWNNSDTFRMIHTQDPATQVDDRYDFILLSQSLVDGLGADYIGDFSTPWDLARWDDPNHSYRCWGNDGTSFNAVLRTTGNVNSGPTIAQALISLSSGLGHLPVYLDARVPAKIAAPGSPIDLGLRESGEIVDFTIDIGSGGDVALWGAQGVEPSVFTLLAGPGLTAPAGVQTDEAGGGLLTLAFALDTSGAPAGELATFVDVVSNDPDAPTRRVEIVATVAPAGGCNAADIAPDFGVLNVNDVIDFVNAFNAGQAPADVSPPGGDGVLNVNDVIDFVNAFNAGCP